MPTIENVSFKKVSIDDWEKLRDIRLKGLQTDPQAFGSVYVDEAHGGGEYWRERFSNPNVCFFMQLKRVISLSQQQDQKRFLKIIG